MAELDEQLDVFGQQPGLNIYTQISFCYPVSDESLYPTTIETLHRGLEQVSESFPWVAGKLVYEQSAPDKPGVFKIKSAEKIPSLVVKDFRNEEGPLIPTMVALRQAEFSFRLLDEQIIAPSGTFRANPIAVESAEVILLQVSFIRGGLILTFNGHHQPMDMTGLAEVIRLLSKACNNQTFSDEEVLSGNPVRRNIIPLLDEDSSKLKSALARQISSPAVAEDAASPPPESAWAYFTFPPQALVGLKALATETVSSGYISTDDALSAFIWQSIARARVPRLSPSRKINFARAIDPRRFIGLPQTYPGLVQNMTYNTHELKELVEMPLGVVASQLRAALDPKTVEYNTRALATLLDRAVDKSSISVTATLDLSADLMLSSWANPDFYGLEFNLGLGKPEAVRRPRFMPVESLLYLMPRTLDGEIAVAICLRIEDMERLKADREFTKYGRYIG